jgi:hypothetical protein
MKYMASLFLTDKVLTEAMTKKVESMQKDGEAGKDFEGEVEGKRVKMWLPEGVREQYRAVMDAEAFLHTGFMTSVDDVFNLEMKLWKLVKDHMLIDGKEGCKKSDEDFSIDFIQESVVMYLSELLFPLYHRGCTRVKEALTSRLTSYISQSVSDSGQPLT